ncbi:hypothetical protein PGIGA_G00137140 [Pangasianodon gigas]|uniref:Uncharacterized protein n=1 Tax=Pangasianodon gigas TaxID=30993 RepID=A0ACC5XKC0_PANGG|nr:hypothetical protein [Pangasianodon gigas]
MTCSSPSPSATLTLAIIRHTNSKHTASRRLEQWFRLNSDRIWGLRLRLNKVFPEALKLSTSHYNGSITPP